MHHFQPESIDRLLETGDAKLVEAFANDFRHRLFDPAPLDDMLAKPQRESRLFCALSVIIECTGGSDVEGGYILAEHLLRYLELNWRNLRFDRHEWLVHVCASSVASAVYGSFLLGRWKRCTGILEQYEPVFPDVETSEQYWNAVAICARACIRANRIQEAAENLRRTPDSFRSATSHFVTADRALKSFMTKRFRVDDKKPPEHAVAAILRRTISDQIPLLRHVRAFEQRRSLPGHLIDERLVSIDAFIDELRDLQALYETNSAVSEVNRTVSEAMFRLQEKLRRFQNPAGGLEQVNFDWVERCLHSTSLLDQIGCWSTSVRHEFLNRLVIAEQWTEDHGDLHGYWLSLWSRCLAFDQLQDESACLSVSKRLYQSIESSRTQATDVEVRSNIANFLPGLAGRVFHWASQRRESGFVADCCELHKGRSLLASRTGLHQPRLSEAGPNALGQRVHYLAYSVAQYHGDIHAVLYSADGRLSVHTIPVTPTTVSLFFRRFVDPSTWKRPVLCGKERQGIQRALSSLLLPLAEAMSAGRVAEEDHVCVAADDPVNLIPLQYLLLDDGRMAVEAFSFSRVASFSEALAISGSPARRPDTGAAVFVPADDRQLASKRQYFDATSAVLARNLDRLDTYADTMVDAQRLLQRLRGQRVVHIDAHGYFSPRENPYDTSGLLVSDGLGPVTRDREPPCVLTPSRLVARAGPMADSHVTLQACVLGLGRPGQGGDVLGMEFALRWIGAASVLAAHWNVRWAQAGRFTRKFYEYWLERGLSRSQAWRASVLEHSARLTGAGAAEWCAFSLFGDWR